jgi:hypothetical protein
MNEVITKVQIIDNNNEKINKYLDKYNNNIDDILYLDDHIILIINTNKFTINPGENIFNSEDNYQGNDVNIAIASAITAYARIHMSYFKNNPLFKLYYSDTDSIVINKPLPTELVGTALGQMKLENTISKAVFIAPKVYGLVTKDGTKIIKVKGLPKDLINDINISDLEILLFKDAIKEFKYDKPLKSLFNGNIKLFESMYTLKVTSNKRQLIYKFTNNFRFDSTKPYYYDEITSDK